MNIKNLWWHWHYKTNATSSQNLMFDSLYLLTSPNNSTPPNMNRAAIVIIVLCILCTWHYCTSYADNLQNHETEFISTIYIHWWLHPHKILYFMLNISSGVTAYLTLSAVWPSSEVSAMLVQSLNVKIYFYWFSSFIIYLVI